MSSGETGLHADLDLGVRRGGGWAVPVLIAVVVSLGILAAAGYVADRCRCRYTAVVFAERQGMQRTTLDLDVPRERRDGFAQALKSVGAMADPDWRLGLVDGAPVVYVDAAHRPLAVELARRWREDRR